MSNERACASEVSLSNDPISDWENERSNGFALCSDRTFRREMERVQSLREQHRRYIESLPKEPMQAINAATQLLHPGGEAYPTGIEEALHFSYALEALIKDANTDYPGRTRDAALYLADRLTFAMHQAVERVDRVSDLLGNAIRATKEEDPNATA
ncbi:hypothetical protein [Aliiroseovarius sp.]|uniref:hypothetical protein n=1 Tax=Aliiroseovarius sp. TaxID=1872442 RepID=UPI003BAD97E0